MMSDLHKKVLTALIGGVILGWFLTAFVFYPPHAGWSSELGVGDLATWFAAAGSVAAAFAARAAARDALRISNEAAQREANRFARQAEVNAAHIFTELVLVHDFAEVVLPFASALASRQLGEEQTDSHAKSLTDAAKHWEMLVTRIDIPSLRELPDECASETAGAVSTVRYICYLVNVANDEWIKKKNLDDLIRAAEEVVKGCYDIQNNFRPYTAYAKRVFSADIDH